MHIQERDAHPKVRGRVARGVRRDEWIEKLGASVSSASNHRARGRAGVAGDVHRPGSRLGAVDDHRRPPPELLDGDVVVACVQVVAPAGWRLELQAENSIRRVDRKAHAEPVGADDDLDRIGRGVNLAQR